LTALPLSIDGIRPALHCSALTMTQAQENTRRAVNADPDVSLFDLFK